MLLSEVPRPPPSNMTGRHSPLPPGPALGFGTGKRATTILADQGDIVTVITDVPYMVRSQHKAQTPGKGTRAMHRSTLTIKTQPHTEYTTTVQTYHSNQPFSDPPPLRPVPFSSQQYSQIRFGVEDQSHWHTNYDHHFPHRGTQPAHQLHYPSQVNKLNMNEGGEMKTVLDAPNAHGNYRYWSQYNRIHNKLGAMLGPGVSRKITVRSSYNPLTGAAQGPAWKGQNCRVSGNRVLYQGHRKDADRYFTLG